MVVIPSDISSSPFVASLSFQFLLFLVGWDEREELAILALAFCSASLV
jgi:hypothetical protein